MALYYLWKTFRLVVVVVFVILFIRTFIVEVGRVNGVSMEPTLNDGSHFFVDKSSLLFSAPKRGDIVQVIEPETGKLLIKRVAGLPGELVSIKENTVWISSEVGYTFFLTESYLAADAITQPAPGQPSVFQLSDDEYFVLGDNRRESIDSRNYGPVARRYIVGRVLTSN